MEKACKVALNLLTKKIEKLNFLSGIKYDYAKDGSIIQTKTSVKPVISTDETSSENKKIFFFKL